MYHPDVIHGQHNVPPSVRNARFRAITHAYGVLRGRISSTGGAGSRDYGDEAMRAELRRRSRRSRSSTTTAADSVRHENGDDTQVWYTLMAFMLAGVSRLPCSLMIIQHFGPSFHSFTYAHAALRIHSFDVPSDYCSDGFRQLPHGPCRTTYAIRCCQPRSSPRRSSGVWHGTTKKDTRACQVIS